MSATPNEIAVLDWLKDVESDPVNELRFNCFVSPYQLANAFEAMAPEELRAFVDEMLGSVGDESARDIVRAFFPKNPPQTEQQSESA